MFIPVALSAVCVSASSAKHAALTSSPPVLNKLPGIIFAAAVNRSVVKFVVAAEAMRSWPDGGSAAKVCHGEATKQAICSGCETPIADEWPGVSIS